MSDMKNTVLVVEDQTVNRKIVCKILANCYTVIEAANGKEALDAIMSNSAIEVILLDLVMPVMNGFEFLEKLQQTKYKSVPVIVMTGSEDEDTEVRALKAGALDFVKKPMNQDILLSRLENALIRNQMVMLQRMEYMATHDTLTQLYNRNKMFAQTRRLIDEHPQTQFAFVRFDIDKFRMYNAAMGEEEGNNFLKTIGDYVRRVAQSVSLCTYGRIEADIFAMCIPNSEIEIERYVHAAQTEIAEYRPDYALDTSFGIYVIDDPSVNIETMYTRASLAADKCKNLYEVHYAYYDANMDKRINEELAIATDMQTALDEEQFVVYLQPKYDLGTNSPCGAEALVRWKHPVKGLISPGIFIPVFERNGFIASLDYYMWEHVCMLIHQWLEAGKHVYPISVNMSRISLFNRHVDELIIGLTQKYQVPPELLNLEVTESAYMANPELMEETIAKLRKAGYIILMDDFGSGYSSLNTLKEIEIDILKLDMKFMPNGSDNGKSEKIVSSIVRMAGWLNMDVIAEGVETVEQRDFLASIGCGYVQGYFYAKPMPVDEYEELAWKTGPVVPHFTKDNNQLEKMEAVWSSSPYVGELLSSIEAPVALFEFASGHVEIIRNNEAFFELYGDNTSKTIPFLVSLEKEDQIKETMEHVIKSGKPAVHDFSYINAEGFCCWLRMKVRKVAEIATSAVVCCLFEEVTKEKNFESSLTSIVGNLEIKSKKDKILVIDDVEVSRAILRSMFEHRYEVIEAEDGIEGIRLLKENSADIAVILLDMIMPLMDGESFLVEKNGMSETSDIPVVVISSESDAAIQLGMLKNGVCDYIVKPFDTDITQQRVENAMAYQSRFKQLVEEYRDAVR